MKIVSVILNYNDARRTCEQVRRIEQYECLGAIVVVDNASTDDSPEKLRGLESDRVVFLQAEKNLGYGAGNNLGVRYACEKLEATHVLIANPDTCFSASCVRAMGKVFALRPRAGVVSAQMQDSQEGLQQTAWPLRSWFMELANSGPVLRRLLRWWINYPKGYFEGRRLVPVGAVHGSMLMVDGAAFLAAGGYDEAVFLYAEENILAWRMRAAGYQSFLLLTRCYEHENSGSISRTYHSMLPKQKLRQASEYYYYVHYLGIGPIRRLVTRGFHRLVLLETMAAERMGLI